MGIEKGKFRNNDLCKMNDNQFAVLVKEFNSNDWFSEEEIEDNLSPILIIFIFTIYNNNQNINYRKYSIDFELYNKHIIYDIRGYNIGDFFGVILGLTLEKNNVYNSRTNFLTFGYMNSTEQDEEYDTSFKYNNNPRILISDYIHEIENNLFGYEFKGVKIFSLPKEEDAGYFVIKRNSKKINVNDILDIDTELKFILNNNFKTDIYSIIFASIANEPDYESMIEYPEEIDNFPNNAKSFENF